MGYGSMPTKRPTGSDLPLEQIQLKRHDQPMDPTAGAFTEAFEYVKKYPGETIVMSLLSLMFSGGSPNFNIPSNFGDSGGSYDSYDSYDNYDYSGGGSDFNYSGWFDGSDLMSTFGPEALLSGHSPLVGALGGGEVAIIAAIIVVSLIVGLVVFAIGAFVKVGSTSMWLRIVRGQNQSLGASFKGAGSFFVPMLGSLFLAGLAAAGGTLLCIIPGIILGLGFYFVHFMVVDKNISYIDALKASWQLTDGHKMSLFVFGILAALLNLAGMLACCVGVLGTNAVVMGAVAVIYNRLAAPGNAYLQDGEGVTSVFE